MANKDLFDDEPKPNSRDDLGFTNSKPERDPDVDKRPPDEKAFGEPSPGPDPVPENACSSSIQYADAKKFVDWIHAQDFPIHEDVTVGHVLVGLSGLGTDALGWLCRGWGQAERAPRPGVMRAAAMKKDVGLLRLENEPEEPDAKRRQRN